MTNKPAQIKLKDEQAHRQTDLGKTTVRWQRLCVSLCQKNVIAGRDIFFNWKKRRNSFPIIDALIQLNMMLSVNHIFEFYRNTYCHTEIELNRVYFLWSCTKYITRFSKYRIELIVALSSTNTTNTDRRMGRAIS